MVLMQKNSNISSDNTTNNSRPKEIDISLLLESSRLRVTDVCESPPEIISVGNSVIGTLGNFSGCTGKAKSKKTFNVCAIVAAAISNKDILKYKVTLPENKRNVIYIDTEQSHYHCLNVFKRILTLAGMTTDSDPANLHFLALRKHAPLVRIAIIERAIFEIFHSTFPISRIIELSRTFA